MTTRKNTVTSVLLLAVLFAGSVMALGRIQSIRGQEATLEEVLYLPSGKVLKRLSLGYSGLLANIYWTRAVQYFGSKHMHHASHYALLYPLLDITTDLDPHLIVAYEYGSIFLSQRPPDGAGQPDKAVALVEKGIRENPTYWRLYFTLGFIHYQDRHDFRAAQEAFEKGSEIPGALPWMKVMAARMAEDAEDIQTAIALWTAVYENNSNKDVKNTALIHLKSLRADVDMVELERRVHIYRQLTGQSPANWLEMVRAGLLTGIPVDPTGTPYILSHDGAVQVQNPNDFPYLGEVGAQEKK
jgi:tetratricopeptide (TPR) repeat protein